MNTTCTSCQTVFRVDPAKVPAAGVRARCSVCSGVFWVRHDSAATVTAPPPLVQPTAPPFPAPGSAVPPVFPSPPVAPMAPAAPAAPLYAPFPGPAAAPPTPGPVPPGTPYRPSAPLAPAMSGTAPPAPVSRPSAPPPVTTAAAPAAPKRPANPFLSQDPSARARRLARALVSDIVVYHPAKRRDALRDGSLKLLFEEEIRKSWEEYVDQVGKPLAESTPFFTDALNEILADGHPVFP